jgi:hypothetical protein
MSFPMSLMITEKLRNHQRYRILAEGRLGLYGLLLLRFPR